LPPGRPESGHAYVYCLSIGMASLASFDFGASDFSVCLAALGRRLMYAFRSCVLEEAEMPKCSRK